MKKALILLTGILILSCHQTNKNASESNAFEKNTKLTKQTENFDWLLGKWKRLNEEPGKETFENWVKISPTEYAGIGFTMQSGDTIKQESIKLLKSKANWNIIVKVPEETASITFLGTSHKQTEFIVENRNIDFPNKIKYWKDGKKIKAAVSNSEMEILFEFEKLE